MKKLKVYYVFAHYGRENGYAIVCAANKKDARTAAYKSGWIHMADIHGVDKFTPERMEDTEEELRADKQWPTEEGQVIPIEWGT